jgi:predicted hydrocarbon binding protein
VSASLSPQFLHHFIDIVAGELGRVNLPVVLEKANLSPDYVEPANLARMDAAAAAQAYATLQRGLRVYYGRGARGVLLRVGRKLWVRLMEHATLGEKMQAQAVRAIPSALRTKAAMDFAAKFLRGESGTVTAHTLDRDIIVSDRNSPTTQGQVESTTICYVTQGFLEEALYWAMGREYEVTETSCRANGEPACEFKIIASK